MVYVYVEKEKEKKKTGKKRSLPKASIKKVDLLAKRRRLGFLEEFSLDQEDK